MPKICAGNRGVSGKQSGYFLPVDISVLRSIEPATLMPEVDRVGNGFIATLGYQAQGYSVETIP
jgi:hypothetical protein